MTVAVVHHQAGHCCMNAHAVASPSVALAGNRTVSRAACHVLAVRLAPGARGRGRAMASAAMPAVSALQANARVTAKRAERYADPSPRTHCRRDAEAGRRNTTGEGMVDEPAIPTDLRNPGVLHPHIADDRGALQQAIKRHDEVRDSNRRVCRVLTNATRPSNLQSHVLPNWPDMEGRTGEELPDVEIPFHPWKFRPRSKSR